MNAPQLSHEFAPVAPEDSIEAARAHQQKDRAEADRVVGRPRFRILDQPIGPGQMPMRDRLDLCEVMDRVTDEVSGFGFEAVVRWVRMEAAIRGRQL
jgi:hypothetical protein